MEKLKLLQMPSHSIKTMLDLYIKRIIIHQFSPNDTELVLAEGPLEITPRLDEYFRKKLSKVFSDEAKRGYFDAENVSSVI